MIEVEARDFENWRRSARALLAGGASPRDVLWKDAADQQAEMFAAPAELGSGPSPRVPRKFIELASAVSCFRDSVRWNLLYRLLFRLTHGEPDLLEIDVDADVHRAALMARSVAHDVHRMHGLVRFRKMVDEDGERFVAWHRPDHYVVERACPFFVERFASMRWAILTPDRSAVWDTVQLRFGPGASRSQAPAGDELEELWREYYRSTFNPARVNPGLLSSHMPKRHWGALPEAVEIPALISGASEAVEHMTAENRLSAAAFIPAEGDLRDLKQAIRRCRGCELHRCATQPVFGEGPTNAKVVLIGEQPGDEEDRGGRPFIGPAGRLLDKALAEAGLDRSRMYVTNAVKHFKFVERGKRRIHQTPEGAEISACRPWLEAEVARLTPKLIVCLGATAAQTVLGRTVRVLRERGQLFPHRWAEQAMITVHPSAILRANDPVLQERDYRMFVEDLKVAAKAAGSG